MSKEPCTGRGKLGPGEGDLAWEKDLTWPNPERETMFSSTERLAPSPYIAISQGWVGFPQPFSRDG